MDGLSIIRAHKLLGLLPKPQLSKETIQKAYIVAAKKYHPDSRFMDSTTTSTTTTKPCAIRFRQCENARNVLLKYYNATNRNNNKTAAAAANQWDSVDDYWQQQQPTPPSTVDATSSRFHQHTKYRKFTWGLKFTILFLALCDGIQESFQKKKNKKKNDKSE